MNIAVDFDHTLVEGNTLLPDAKEAMQAFRDKGHSILIHSCNNPEWIRLVLNNNDVPYDDVWEGAGKPVCHVYIDDRALRFTGDWEQTLQDVNAIAAARKEQAGLRDTEGIADSNQETIGNQ